MTNEQLCALALAAIDDADARAVLADAIEASGWKDGGQVASVLLRTAAGGAEWNQRVNHGRHMGPLSARAIAAVLLFGEWPTRWELAERCPLLVPYRWPTEMLRRYRQGDTEPALAVAQFPRDAVGDD